MPDDALQQTLRALRWSFEREEETARLYHNRSQLVLTVVSAILGVGFFRLGSPVDGDSLVGSRAAVGVSCLVGVSMLFAVFAVFSTVAGMRLPWKRVSRERDRHVASLLLLSGQLFDGLAEGDDERVAAELIGQLNEAVREFSDKNEERRLEIRNGLSWLLAALAMGFLAVGIYVASYAYVRLNTPGQEQERGSVRAKEEATVLDSETLGGEE